jgi:hypothetical protein
MPFNEAISSMASIIFAGCNVRTTRATALILTDFLPNEQLVVAENQERWQAIASAIRTSMSEVLNVKLCEQQHNEHLRYYDFLTGKAESYTTQ